MKVLREIVVIGTLLAFTTGGIGCSPGGGGDDSKNPPANSPPTATLTVSTSQGYQPLDIEFDCNCSDPDAGDTLTSMIRIQGNGVSELFTGGPSLNRNYILSDPGDYTMTGQCTDSKGAKSLLLISSVIVLPSPISQHVDLVNRVDFEYSAILTGITDGATLKVFWGERQIAQRDITHENYSETFSSMLKGDYSFVLEAYQGGLQALTDSIQIQVPDYAPIPVQPLSDLEELTLNEEETKIFQLPILFDENVEDSPQYIAARNTDSKVSVVSLTPDGSLILRGNLDEVDIFNIDIDYVSKAPEGNSVGFVITDTVSGYIENLADISGTIEDAYSDIPHSGRITVFSENNSSGYVLSSIASDENGYFSLQLPTRDHEIVYLKANLTESPQLDATQISYIRSIEVSGTEDTPGKIIRPFSYDPLVAAGITPEDFSLHLQETNTGLIENSSSRLRKWIQPPKVQILTANPVRPESYFTQDEINLMQGNLISEKGVRKYLQGYAINKIVIGDIEEQHYTLSGIENNRDVLPDQGWVVVVPDSTMGSRGVCHPYVVSDGEVNRARIKLNTSDVYPDIAYINDMVFNHEFGHAVYASGGADYHAHTLAPIYTIMHNNVTSYIVLDFPGPGDEIAGYFVGEDSYAPGTDPRDILATTLSESFDEE